MPEALRTTGNRALDAELDSLRAELKRLASKLDQAVLKAATAPVQAVIPTGVISLQADGGDPASGFLALTGENGIAISGGPSEQGFTFGLLVDLLTADPASPVDGQVWFRTDLLQLCIREGGVTRLSPVFT